MRLCHWPQVIHLIRHGEGFHNVAGELDERNYLDHKFEDAHLTEFGWRQVCRRRCMAHGVTGTCLHASCAPGELDAVLPVFQQSSEALCFSM